MKHSGTTAIARAVQEAVGNDPILDTHLDPCQSGENKPSDCKLAKGLEGLFVAEIASRFHQALRENKPEWGFHQCVYMPSTRIERKCGFDVSFGRFDHPLNRRVRLMHKLIRCWCDDSWEWHSNKEKDSEGVHRAADHIFNLVNQCRLSGGRISPYVSCNVCFCLHEYRRMGSAVIAPFEDTRRSLFVELSPLCGVIPPEFDSKDPSGRLEISHSAHNGVSSVSACWIDVAGVKTVLEVCSWQRFIDSTKGFLVADE